jgi:Zn-dependent hydrolases, including glyoxylases
MRITAISTGTLKLKPVFLEGSPNHGGSLGLMLAIARDPGFTQSLPMWSWIVETDDERILIDAGAAPGAGGGPTRTKFEVAPDQSLVHELARQGLTPTEFDRVFLTHMHGDHVGGIGAFHPRRVWVSRAEWAPVSRFPGSLMRPLTAPVPRRFAPTVFDFTGPPMYGFPASLPLTKDGSIVALPTPGHSPGHTSYLVRRADADVLLAGDVTYDLPALHEPRDQGFVADVEKHHETLPRVAALVKSGVRYLPSHDPEAPARL